ncbi:MAG TPA: NACHT domain-containing protein [Streptosporangiaceae bacterium]
MRSHEADRSEAALEIGTAVVKAACAIWLGDVGAVVGGLSDLLASRVRSRLERHRIELLFGQCTDIVADKVLALLDHEFRGLPGNELNAAVLAVADTFHRAGLDGQALVQADLDARLVERGLASARAAVLSGAALSEPAEALYDRVLHESCAYLVEVVTTLPRFEVGALTELLRRDTAILDTLRGVLSRLPERRGPDDFAADYRRQVVNKLDRMELFGVTLGEASRRYPLSVAYVSLTVLRQGRRRQRDRRLSTGLRVEEALADEHRVLLVGEAGCGKTTLLHWLAVRSARQDFTGPLADWNRTVPFYVPLRRYVEQELPAPERFLDAVGRHIAQEMPPGWVQGLLRDGRALVLVDGVDELREGVRREAARDWLRELATAFPKARYVVTSRPAAVTERWLARKDPREDFTAIELQPMSQADMRAFVQRWHHAMSQEIVDAEERERLDGDERALLTVIEADRHLRALAVNPLLCALLCALNRERNRDLPRDRMEVYAAALEMLLGRRDRARQIASPAELTTTAQTILLQDLAFWLLRNGWSDAPMERVKEHIARSRRNLPRVDATPWTLLRHLLERSGLLREPTVGRVDFIHRTFQEYLAGKAAVEGDEIGFLVANALDDQWREVIIMAAGHAQPKQRDELLDTLLHPSRHDFFFGENREKLSLIAVACLQTAPQISPEQHAEIDQLTRELIPPKSVEAAESLAAAGEMVLDVLAERPPRDIFEAAASVRAAALIGGPDALTFLGAMAARWGGYREVSGELIRAWRVFDADAYARDVLSKVPSLTELGLVDGSSLPGIVHLRGLRVLSLEIGQDSSDLSPLAELPELEFVSLTCNMTLPRIAPLAAAPKLTTLRLAGRLDPADLRPIAGFSTLVSLRLVRSSMQAAPSLLAELPERPPGLRGLEIVDWPFAESLAGLERWDGLTDLAVVSCPELTDLSTIGQLASLERLELVRVGAGELVGLRRLRRLRRLSLEGWHEVDLTPLAGMRDLTVRVIGPVRLHGADLLGRGSSIVDSADGDGTARRGGAGPVAER